MGPWGRRFKESMAPAALLEFGFRSAFLGKASKEVLVLAWNIGSLLQFENHGVALQSHERVEMTFSHLHSADRPGC